MPKFQFQMQSVFVKRVTSTGYLTIEAEDFDDASQKLSDMSDQDVVEAAEDWDDGFGGTLDVEEYEVEGVSDDSWEQVSE